MTCKLEPEFKPTKTCNLVFIEQQQQQFNIRPTDLLHQNSRYAMSTAETCNIIDNTIDSLKRSMALIAERLNKPSTQTIPNPISTMTSETLPETSEMNCEPTENSIITFETFKDETQMPDIMRVITKELSEPYSIYTYRYFIKNWPELCLLAKDTSNGCHIGVIVCKLDQEPKWRRGYIAMLAVEEAYRRRGIGMELVKRSIEAMRQIGCDEVMLETEVTNTKALALYSRLGFIRERRLLRYYLNGVDAFRLKLLFADCWPEQSSSIIDELDNEITDLTMTTAGRENTNIGEAQEAC
uniref:N-acetyltransferase domain-containing protein n=1 Tax=Panagrolaimus sp. JU765 TaxID=591449 RepID=A0AC34RKR3_9BILA